MCEPTWTRGSRSSEKSSLANRIQASALTRKALKPCSRLRLLSCPIYVLEEGGTNVAELDLAEDGVFVLGDHVGLPRNVERFALRFGEKISLGKQPYLAASCITIINYLLDRRAKSS